MRDLNKDLGGWPMSISKAKLREELVEMIEAIDKGTLVITSVTRQVADQIESYQRRVLVMRYTLGDKPNAS